MKYGLGIDTGGTYTDAVILDFASDRLLATAKSITVKEDLKVGILGAISQLPADYLDKLSLVSLSTTLATNACVEGKGSRAKLILIGCSPEIVSAHGREYGLPERQDIIFLEGGHDQQGLVKAAPNWDFLQGQIMDCRQETDAFAIVELWGIRNPGFENHAKTLIAGWTGMQVVCGHELTGEVNSLKRAASALLNAQLIPIIHDFLDAVTQSLKQMGIKAPIVIVRGDGSLMSEDFARSKPVETLLCGPAASVAGGLYLSGRKDCVIIDMGGTTSDIAVVRNGIPRLSAEGTKIGTWKTGIRSIQIDTVGLGADSLIRHNWNATLSIGPVRVAPLCWAASRWPRLLTVMRALATTPKLDEIPLCEFFYLVQDRADDPYFSLDEQAIVQALQAGPLSLTELAEALGVSIVELKLKRLEHLGIVMRCGLTPTDIMHLTSDFSAWNSEAAAYGADIMAHQIGRSREDLVLMVLRTMQEKLYMGIVNVLLEEENEAVFKQGISSQLEQLVLQSFRKNPTSDSLLACRFSTRIPMVGIGAPIHVYLPLVAGNLASECIIPEHAAVANAVGAIIGNVIVEETVLVRPLFNATGLTGYRAWASTENQDFPDMDQALSWAKEIVANLARNAAVTRGATAIEVTVRINKTEVTIGNSAQHMIETMVSARASGKIGYN